MKHRDLTKTNADYNKLKNYFEDLKEQYAEEVEKKYTNPSPVDTLREMIPSSQTTKITSFSLDDDSVPNGSK